MSGTVLMVGNQMERGGRDNLQWSGSGLTWGGGMMSSTEGRVMDVPKRAVSTDSPWDAWNPRDSLVVVVDFSKFALRMEA